MGNVPLYNAVIVVTDPELNTVGVSLTLPGQSGKIFRQTIAEISATLDQDMLKQRLRYATSQIDHVSVNAPTAPPPEPAAPSFDLPRFLEDLADGKLHVVRNETGEPVIEEGTATAPDDLLAVMEGRAEITRTDDDGTPFIRYLAEPAEKPKKGRKGKH